MGSVLQKIRYSGENPPGGREAEPGESKKCLFPPGMSDKGRKGASKAQVLGSLFRGRKNGERGKHALALALSSPPNSHW